MKPLIINTYSFNHSVGGIKVMHKLCDELNKRNYPTYLCPIERNIQTWAINPAYNTPLVTQELIDNINDCIVLYPEGIADNPLNCNNVIRWALGPPEKQIYEQWKESDIIYWYMDLYKKGYTKDLNNNLEVIEYHEDIFFNENKERFIEACWTLRKGKKYFPNIWPPTDSVEITWADAGNLERLSYLFNMSKRFVSYDPFTFLSVQAALCGCESVIIPNSTITEEHWLSSVTPLFRASTYYGEHDKVRYLQEKQMLLPYLQNSKDLMKVAIELFMEHINEL